MKVNIYIYIYNIYIVFFILNGSVRFVDNTGHIFKIYSEGNYFGEIDILEHVNQKIYIMLSSQDHILL